MQSSEQSKKSATEEYVAGSFYSSRNPNILPFHGVDPYELRLDQDLIDQMALDSEIFANVGLLADSVLSDGITVIPAVSDKSDEFPKAKEIADFIKIAIDLPNRSLAAITRDMFVGSFLQGQKVAEIVLRYRKDSRVDGKLVLDRVNPKPGEATAFVTDKFLNVLGLMGARRAGETPAIGARALRPDEIIPREKFFILTFEQEDNDPRGVSQVRSIVEDFCEKTRTELQWKEWRRTSAIPKKVGTTAPNQKDVELKNPDGTPVVENGIRKTVSAQVAMTKALDSFENNSSIGIPNGADVKQLEVTGTGAQFQRCIQMCNSAIRKLILGDALATGGGDRDARAARESSKDVVDIRKQAYRTLVSAAIQNDIFQLLTVVNFGEDKAHLTPKCFLGDTEANDWATDVQAAARAGYKLAPRHLRQLDVQFGLEPRNKELGN